jgi:hypothetical protein
MSLLSTRRDFLQHCGGGLGMVALSSMLQQEQAQASVSLGANPMGARFAHHGGKAKSIIWLFMNGGPSQVDTWDYKPELEKHHGKKLDGFDSTTGFFNKQVGLVAKSPFSFQQHGRSGAWVSEIFPHLSQHVDKMAFIKSFHTESNNHSPALFMMNTGVPRMGNPCVGSWATYGLGTENQNLPSFVVMSDPLNRGLPKGHASNWSSGFLPGVFQGTWFRPQGEPIPNLKRVGSMSDAQQQKQLKFIEHMNRIHLEKQAQESELTARIKSFELAYNMQKAAPEVLDVDGEPEHIRKSYGLDQKHCTHFARQCLMARKMVEEGVRFVQIYSGGMENSRSWDGHKDIQKNHGGFALETDQPIAALLADLEQRGLLDETLVVWGGEFGRLPVSQGAPGTVGKGRDHNPHCATYWMAGGGVKPGVSYGESDEIGHKAEVDKVHVNDLHATMLHLMGMDHKKLTYKHNGRRFRLTDVGGHVIDPIVA